MKDNFLMKVIEDSRRRGVLLDLVLTNKEGPVGSVKAGGNLGCSNNVKVEFKMLYGRNKEINKIVALDIRRANFDLFKNLLGGILVEELGHWNVKGPKS